MLNTILILVYNSYKMWNNFLHFLVTTAFLHTKYCYNQLSGSKYSILAYNCQWTMGCYSLVTADCGMYFNTIIIITLYVLQYYHNFTWYILKQEHSSFPWYVCTLAYGSHACNSCIVSLQQLKNEQGHY